MDYPQALEFLRSLVPAPAILSESEIGRIEQDLRCTFPEEYRRLLSHLGPCTLFSDQASNGIEILDPRKVRDVFRDSFEDVETWVGSRVMPVGLDHRLQEVAGYLWNRPPGANFVVMSHEYYFEDLWQDRCFDEEMWMKTLRDWIVELAETQGRPDIH